MPGLRRGIHGVVEVEIARTPDAIAAAPRGPAGSAARSPRDHPAPEIKRSSRSEVWPIPPSRRGWRGDGLGPAS